MKTERELILAKYDGLQFASLTQAYWTGIDGNCFLTDYMKWRVIMGIKGGVDEAFRLDVMEYIVEWADAATPKEITLAFEMNAAGLFPKRVVSYNSEITRPVIAEILEQYSVFRDKAQKALNNKILLLQPPPAEPDKEQTDKLIWDEIMSDADKLQKGEKVDFYELKYDFLQRTKKKEFSDDEKKVAYTEAQKVPPQQFIYPILNPERYQNDVKVMWIFLSKKQLYTDYLKTLSKNEGDNDSSKV